MKIEVGQIFSVFDTEEKECWKLTIKSRKPDGYHASTYIVDWHNISKNIKFDNEQQQFDDNDMNKVFSEGNRYTWYLMNPPLPEDLFTI